MPTLIPGARVPAIIPQGNTPAPSLIWGIGPQYSYEHNDFQFDNSNDIMLNNEAVQLSQWITNALITPRMRYYIHRMIFGSDFDLIYGKNYPRNVIKNAAESYVKEALSTDPRIKSIKQVGVAVQLKYAVIWVIITTAKGNEQQFEVRWSVP